MVAQIPRLPFSGSNSLMWPTPLCLDFPGICASRPIRSDGLMELCPLHLQPGPDNISIFWLEIMVHLSRQALRGLGGNPGRQMHARVFFYCATPRCAPLFASQRDALAMRLA